MRTQQEGGLLQAKKKFHQLPDLDLGLLALRAVKEKFLLCKPMVVYYGSLS